MKLKAITSLREIIIDTEDMKSQNRGGKGINIFGLDKKLLKKNEELIRIEEVE